MEGRTIGGSAIGVNRSASAVLAIVFTFIFGLACAGTSARALAGSGEAGCLVASAPVQETIFVEVSQQDVPNTMNRYIALAAGDAGVNQAIRLVVESASTPQLEHLVGRVFWAGPKEANSENGGSRLPTPGFRTFWASLTQCEPFFDDWSGFCAGGACVDTVCIGGPDAGDACNVDDDCAKDCEAGLKDGVCDATEVCAGGPNDGSPCTSDFDCPGEPCSTDGDCWGGIISIYGEAIVPGLTVSVQVVSEGCDLSQESSFSDLAVMATAQWGDILSNCQQIPCTPGGDGPNMNDIFGSIQTFQSSPLAPRKARADVEPSLLDGLENITDVLQLVNAFQGLPYSLLGISTCNDGRCTSGGSYGGMSCGTDEDCVANLCP